MLLLGLLVVAFLGGCNSRPAPVAPQEDSPPGLSPANSGLSEGESDDQENPTASEDDLILWVPPFFSIDSAERADAVLAAALAEMTPAIPTFSLSLVPKAERGAAGILSYLLSTHRAASALLPDVALIQSLDLARIVEVGMLRPLTPEEAASFAGIAPSLLATAQLQNEQYALPFVADMEHLVYHTDRMTTPPATWEEFLAQEGRLLFAGGAADDRAVSLAWTFYRLGGGRLDEQGNLTDRPLMEAVFTLLASGREQGLIPANALALSSPQAVWTYFVNGDAEMAIVPASLYYAQRSEAGTVGYAPIPTQNGNRGAVVTSWSFAVITQDPARRKRALRFLEELFTPSVQGAWSWAAQQMPTQEAAFAYWESSDPYALFLQQMLDASVPARPYLPGLADVAQTTQQLQRTLLGGELTPQQAMENLPLRP